MLALRYAKTCVTSEQGPSERGELTRIHMQHLVEVCAKQMKAEAGHSLMQTC